MLFLEWDYLSLFYMHFSTKKPELHNRGEHPVIHTSGTKKKSALTWHRYNFSSTLAINNRFVYISRFQSIAGSNSRYETGKKSIINKSQYFFPIYNRISLPKPEKLARFMQICMGSHTHDCAHLILNTEIRSC